MKNQGYTLIETIISIAIIGIIAISILAIFNSGLINITKAGNRTKAVSIAEDTFLNDGEIIDESIEIEVQLPNVDDMSNYKIKGKVIKGEVILNSGFKNETKVEIKAFVPNS